MSKPVILIVDDITANIDVMREILKDDYTLKIAINGEMALRAVKTDPVPDLILLDIMMPVMNGYEVCRRLKDDIVTRTIPVIFITAKDDQTDEAEGFRLGAVDYITKPVNPLTTRSRIRSHLALYDVRKELRRQVREATREIFETRLTVIKGWGRAAEFRDNDTGLHIERMSLISRMIAAELGLPERDTELIFQAAPMHDIGKIGVPDSVLLKPAKLDDNEWVLMKQHPSIGAAIIGNDDSPLLRFARQGALTHHEKWDGSGYPAGLKGEDIPLVGRILALADVYDALMSVRPYKKAWPAEQVEELIENESGHHFDPRIAEAALSIRGEIQKIQRKYHDE